MKHHVQNGTTDRLSMCLTMKNPDDEDEDEPDDEDEE